MVYKDSANKKSNQQNLGVIRSSNLCSEIIEYSDSKEYACCTLASIGLPAFMNKDNIFDYQHLGYVVGVITRNLNSVIDKNFYPVPETELSNKKPRPLGIGVQGLADVYCMMKLPFDSDGAKLVNEKIFATIYYYAMKMSIELAKEHAIYIKTNIHYTNPIEKDILDLETKRKTHKGSYSSFIGSPLSQGKFQFDLWEREPICEINNELVLDWDNVRKDVMAHGARNSLLLAPMPTASTSQILCNNECIEPFTTNIYARSTLAGTFEVINKHLLKDLIELGIWNNDIKNKLILNRGSIQNIPEIPKEIKDIYKTTWELKQKQIIDQSIDRGKYICQSQSLNLFMEEPTFNKLSAMHFYTWENGLKTGLYYLRTKAKAVAQQFTVDPLLKNDCEYCTS
jgi:ribonucleoside-diphosphate reductase alpha chain